MKDKDFYASGQHPEAGSEMIYIKGQWVEKHSINYMKSQTPVPQGLNQIKSENVNSAGFKSSKVIKDDKKYVPSERQELLDRLAILQNTEARLLKDLEKTRSVIKSIKSDLSI